MKDKQTEIFRSITNTSENNWQSTIGIYLLRGLTWFIILIFLLILGVIYVNGSEVISWEFLLNAPSGNVKTGGIGFAVFGTFALCLFMIILSVPIGVLSAIYLSEYAQNNKLKKIIRISINNLAGVPSIVFGLFGLGFFVLIVGKSFDKVLSTGLLFGKPSLLWASATLAILVLPTIIVSTLESLERVPKEQRDSAFGLGATKWQVIKKIVVPQARPGILTGIILAVSRGAGEVAPVLFLGCAFFLPDLPVTYLNMGLFSVPLINPAEQFMFLAYNIFVSSIHSPNTSLSNPYQYGTVLVLITMVLIFNITAVIFRYRFRKILDEVTNH
ncbi:MAG: phosphate ABC transporter permease PstA [bacterium]